MDIRTIKKLIELVKDTGVAELEICEDKDSVRITNHQNRVNGGECATNLQTAPGPNETTSSQQTCPAPTVEQCVTLLDGHQIVAPMIGTVYLAASPGAKNFAEVGQSVKAGDVICLIEAMKMFNRIEADKDGVIKKCLVKNGQPVEYGQALFLIDEK